MRCSVKTRLLLVRVEVYEHVLVIFLFNFVLFSEPRPSFCPPGYFFFRQSKSVFGWGAKLQKGRDEDESAAPLSYY